MDTYDSPWGSSEEFESRLAVSAAVDRRLRWLQDAVRETREACIELQADLDAAVECDEDSGYLHEWVAAAQLAYGRLLADLHAYRSEHIA